MVVREIWIGLKDDAEDGYSLDECEIWNFSNEFYVRQDLGCESAGDTINIAMVGWCCGTSS